MNIHPTAIIDSSTSFGKDVKIGAFSVIGPDVVLGDNVELKSHVVIETRTTIGEGTIIYPFASIGQAPQILKYKGEKSEVIIGSHNTIREYVTIQAGSADGGMVTIVGDNNLFMVGSHIGHDCKIGNNIIFANNAAIGGHVEIGDFAVIGGLAAVHQFVRIGAYAMIGGVSAVVRDVIPFGLAVGDRACLEGVNFTGMKRHGFENSEILDTKKAVESIFFAENDTLFERIEKVKQEFVGNKAIEQIIAFLRQDSSRSFCGSRK